MMDELKDALTAILYVLVFVAVIGFVGWYTEPPQRTQEISTKGVRT
jgi:hypothetical protein